MDASEEKRQKQRAKLIQEIDAEKKHSAKLRLLKRADAAIERSRRIAAQSKKLTETI